MNIFITSSSRCKQIIYPETACQSETSSCFNGSKLLELLYCVRRLKIKTDIPHVSRKILNIWDLIWWEYIHYKTNYKIFFSMDLQIIILNKIMNLNYKELSVNFALLLLLYIVWKSTTVFLKFYILKYLHLIIK